MKLFRYLSLSLAILLLPAAALAASTANFIITSSAKSVEMGKSFSVAVSINPGGNSIDTARVQINFPANLLKANGLSLNGQLTSASPGNFIDNNAGTISWGAFTVDSPITQTSAYGHISFTPKALGRATIQVLAASKLIDNGTEVGNVGSQSQVSLEIGASTDSPQIILGLTSSTHPDSNKWYQSNAAQFKWSAVGNGQYLWAFDQSPDTIPTKPISDHSKQVFGIKNGIWYFHLSAIVSGQSIVTHYRVQVDSLKPNPLEPYLDLSDLQNLILKFATTDYDSGIAGYNLQINQQQFDNVTSPYTVRGIIPGANMITVTALDNAGNLRSGWLKFILDADGAIHDIVTSSSGFNLCGTFPPLCGDNWPLISVAVLLALALLFVLLQRKRVDIMDVKTTTKTDVGTVSKTTTRTDPKTGKKIITKTVTKTDVKNIVETDTGAVSKDKLDNNPHIDDNHHKN